MVEYILCYTILIYIIMYSLQYIICMYTLLKLHYTIHAYVYTYR